VVDSFRGMSVFCLEQLTTGSVALRLFCSTTRGAGKNANFFLYKLSGGGNWGKDLGLYGARLAKKSSSSCVSIPSS